jgi:uncharacterized membrane protein
MLRRSLALFGVVFLVFVGVRASSAIPYYLTDLGPAGSDTMSEALAVNLVSGAPESVGISIQSPGTAAARVPAAWIGGTPTSLLGSLPGASAGKGNQADGIDGNGDIVGQTLVSSVQSAFYLPHGGSGTILPLLNGGTGPSSAAGVNNGGLVVGYTSLGTYYNADSESYVPCPQAFVWSAATGIVNLGSAGVPSYATAISADGNTIIGDYGAAVGQQGQAVKWTKSGSTWTMTPLVPLSTYAQSSAYAINSSGDVTGSCFDYSSDGFPSTDQLAILVKHDGMVVTLGDLGLPNPWAYGCGINDSGVIAGYDSSASPSKAIVNYGGVPGGCIDLNTLLSPVSGAGWTVTNAYGIDNNGDIVGRGTNPAGVTQGFLLKPAISGDANLDGKVDINDLTVVLTSYGQSGMVWSQGDFNGDGKVDINDLTIVLTNYGKTAGLSFAAVPEPSAIAILLAGAIGLLAYAWRRRK